MSKLEYNSNLELELDGVRLHTLVKEGADPAYVYSRKGLVERLAQFQSAVARALSSQRFSIHYAMKANSHLEILRLFRGQNIGVDIVSGGELKRALEAGFSPAQILFSGVAKSKEEIRLCLQSGIRQFNVESLPELQRIAQIARDMGKKAAVVLRVNPDVDAQTHPYISTGFRENKFGIETVMIPEALRILKESPHLSFVGLSSHIGSQLLEFSAFREALQKQRRLFEDLRAQGFALNTFDVGGGLGIDYASNGVKEDSDQLQRYSQVLQQELSGLEAQIQFEPGRYLVARSGVLLTEIQDIKKTSERNFILCNTGMHHMIRPALYEAEHRILPLLQRTGDSLLADVVGPVCESSDFLGKQRQFVGLKESDWLCVADSGAYGAAMMSDYNLFARPREIFV